MPALGGRLHAIGRGRSQSEFAVAFSSDGKSLVFLGGVGANREFRPGTFRTYSAHDMTDGKLSGHAILIVEDDQLLKLLVVDIVENAGFVAHHAGNADEAVAILESRSDIALLLTDINMPGSMDGLKLAHAVRNRWQPIKIIVVSSRVPDQDLPTDSRFFVKPYHAGVLISEMRSLIGS
jgi:two-component system, response regulator PdtaR